jgi:hypothetical protein
MRYFLAAAVLAGIVLAAGCSSGAAEPPASAVIIATITPAPPQGSEAVAGQPSPTPSTRPETPPPTTGRWLDVDLTSLQVRLMESDRVLQTIGPVAIGEQVDTGAYESTQTGLFHVYAKTEELAYDAPYDTYISHWVGFDIDKANGFHSFLKDASGTVVDSSTGRISNGCIRTGDPEAIFAFAEIGMPVLVHE